MLRAHRFLGLLPLTLTATVGVAQEAGTIVDYTEGIRDFTSENTGYAEIDLPGYFTRVHPDVAIWYQHVNTLANPWFEGRQPGTRGDDLATEYIEFHLGRAGLEPAFRTEADEPSWRQPFTFRLGNQVPVLEASHVAAMDDVLVHEEDYTVLANAGNGNVTAPLTFVGYAIEDGIDGYDSFGDTEDLSGRIAVMLRYEPLDSSGISRWADEGFSSYSGIRGKMSSLINRNASGIIMVTPPGALDAAKGLETLQSSRRYRPRASVPVIHLSPEAADTLLTRADARGRGLDELIRAANRDRIDTVDFEDDVTVTLDLQMKKPGIATRNVAGVIPGRGDLADEWLILGGHYDHLGSGYTGSRRPRSNEIHNGADDNASGTAALLVMADRLARFVQTHEGDHRSVMVMGFGAEEAGLHGSAFFVENPPMDLEQVTCMLNFDMMGRLGTDGVQVLGTGTAEEFDELLVPHVERSGLRVNSTRSGSGPSDHSSFYRKDVPVLFFFSGITDDYHTPDDDSWTLNPEGAVRIIDLADGLARELITRPEQLQFQRSDSSAARRGTGSRVRLGVMPGYAADLDRGVMIDGVSTDTAAEAAGIQKGDVMLTWNGKEIDGPGGLMSFLRDSEPGDEIAVEVLRSGDTRTLTVTLRGIDDSNAP